MAAERDPRYGVGSTRSRRVKERHRIRMLGLPVTYQEVKDAQRALREKQSIETAAKKPVVISTSKKPVIPTPKKSLVLPRINDDNNRDQTLEEVRKRHRFELSSLENRQTTISEGFVYIIVNPAWSDAIKIGSAIDYEDRLNTFQTADPNRAYSIVYTHYTLTRKQLEEKVHAKLSDHRIGGEWFRCQISVAIATIKELG